MYEIIAVSFEFSTISDRPCEIPIKAHMEYPKAG